MEESSEEESAGASSVNDTEEENGGSSSENETEREASNKRPKLEGKVDRISDLPDFLIHHILSFLPTTKEAIRTGILSQRWQNQWTRVPVLIFDSTGKNDKNFSQFIDRTLALHDCSKLKKFHVRYDYHLESDPHLCSKIRFATRKDVEELILHLFPQDENGEIPYVLPKFLYNNGSLVKLELFKCAFIPCCWKSDWSINWPRLKELKLECYSISDSVIEKVVSGSPLLELLELTRCFGFCKLVIASKSLKKLIFIDSESNPSNPDSDEGLEISCPNLEELSVMISEDSDIPWSDLPGKTIENVLSGSLLLHTLVLPDFGCFDRLVIVSKSLKKLVLGKIYRASDFEISCPDLEELNLYRFQPDVFCAQRKQCLAMKMLGQIQRVDLLEIGSWFIKILSALEVESLSSPLLNCKCLTLDGSDFDGHLPGIVRAIRTSPGLEKLVMKLQLDQPAFSWNVKDCRRKNCWNADETVFNCSVSNLKTIKIVGLSKRDVKHKLVFNFVEFLLKNAKVLEKVVVVLADRETDFVVEVSTKL